MVMNDEAEENHHNIPTKLRFSITMEKKSRCICFG